MQNYELVFENDIAVVKLLSNHSTVEIASSFKAELHSFIDNISTKKIVIDFLLVEFVDSTFLGAIVSGLRKIAALNGDIKICSLQPPVSMLFELTRLNKVFQIFDDTDSAIKKFEEIS